MIGDFIFSWAENAEGRMVHVDSVPRGLRCGCTCLSLEKVDSQSQKLCGDTIVRNETGIMMK